MLFGSGILWKLAAPLRPQDCAAAIPMRRRKPTASGIPRRGIGRRLKKAPCWGSCGITVARRFRPYTLAFDGVILYYTAALKKVENSKKFR